MPEDDRAAVIQVHISARPLRMGVRRDFFARLVMRPDHSHPLIFELEFVGQGRGLCRLLRKRGGGKKQCGHQYSHGIVHRHSLFKEISGSIRVARRAGIQQANNETISKTNAIPPKVSGSVALTPNSSLCNNRVNAKAQTNPPARPIATNLRFSPITSFRMSLRSAPNARRMPSSPVRCATEYATTP